MAGIGWQLIGWFERRIGQTFDLILPTRFTQLLGEFLPIALIVQSAAQQSIASFLESGLGQSSFYKIQLLGRAAALCQSRTWPYYKRVRVLATE